MAQMVWPWRPWWGSWGTQWAGTPHTWPPPDSPDMGVIVILVVTRWPYHWRDDCWHEATQRAVRHLLTAQPQGRGHWPLMSPLLGSFPRGQRRVIRPQASSVVSLNLECDREQEEGSRDLQMEGIQHPQVTITFNILSLTTMSTRKRVMARGRARPWPPKKILSTDEKRPPSSCLATSSVDCAPCSAYWSP